MATATRAAWVPSALKNASATSDGNGGDSQAGSLVDTNGERPSPAAAAVAADADAVAASVAAPSTTQQITSRSPASLAFPSVAPVYGGSTTSTLPSRTSPPPPQFPQPPSRSVPGVDPTRQAPESVQQQQQEPYRRGSSVLSGERPSVLERQALEAQAALETANQLRGDVAVVEAKVLGAERQLEAVREAILAGSAYRGKERAALAAEEERLVVKERLLREKEVQLREERLMFLRKSQNVRPGYVSQRRDSDGFPGSAKQKRVSFIMRHTIDDPEEEKVEQQRVAEVEDLIRRQSVSVGGGSTNNEDDEGLHEMMDNSSVIHVHKLEEDPRLLHRMEAFSLPILVATLLSGFTLVLFDVAKTLLARRLAVLAFALETSSSTVLCLIAFRGQQLYSYATATKPLLRPFLQKMCQVQVLSLVLFSLGVMAFVASFVVEASDEMGDPWLATLALILLPTVLAAILFAASTKQVRRHSFPPSCTPNPSTPGRIHGVPGE